MNQGGYYNALGEDLGYSLDELNLEVINEFLEEMDKTNCSWFKIMVMESWYWTNLYKFEVSDRKVKRLLHDLMRILFLYGSAAITLQNEKYVLCTIRQVVKRDQTDILEAIGIPTTQFFWNRDVNKSVSYKLTDKNTVFFQYNYFKLPAWYFMKQFFDGLDKHLKIYNTIRVFFAKHLTIDCGAQPTQEVLRQIQRMYQGENPFILTNGGIALNSSTAQNEWKIAELPVPQQRALEFWDSFDKWQRYWYGKFGRSVNTMPKRERHITAEIDLEAAPINVIRQEIRFYLDESIERMNELFNLNIKIIDVENEQEQADKTSAAENEDGDYEKV